MPKPGLWTEIWNRYWPPHAHAQTLVMPTVFARSDATATIYFIARVCAAFIREWRLFESGVY
jgi:hypothetical protein